MIQANELRIGNFISERDNHRIYPISEISEYGVKVKYWSCGETQVIYYNKLIPVILTPEILEKCGFKKPSNETSGSLSVDFGKSYITLFDRKRLILCFDDNGLGQINTYWVENVGMPEVSLTFNIKFLHQLQNLYFALTGEELKISL